MGSLNSKWKKPRWPGSPNWVTPLNTARIAPDEPKAERDDYQRTEERRLTQHSPDWASILSVQNKNGSLQRSECALGGLRPTIAFQETESFNFNQFCLSVRERARQIDAAETSCPSSKPNPQEFIGGFDLLAIACVHGDADKRRSPTCSGGW